MEDMPRSSQTRSMTPQSGNMIENEGSQGRPLHHWPENIRSKRAKYASTACNECRRGKTKCIRRDDQDKCQRCAAMGEQCVVVASTSQSSKGKDTTKRKHPEVDPPFESLRNEVASLRQEVATLAASVSSLRASRNDSGNGYASTPRYHLTPNYTNTSSERLGKPEEPQFVGPTRSIFGFDIAGTSLDRMGISTERTNCESRAASVASLSPEPTPRLGLGLDNVSKESDCLLDFSHDELVRLLGIFQEEVACVHPFIDTREMVDNVSHVLEYVRTTQRSQQNVLRGDQAPLRAGKKDVHLLKIAVATAIIHEAKGRNDVSTRLVQSIEPDICRISNDAKVQLKDLQTMTMLSIYYFHDEEELLAWRTIGIAARQALEMGLHQRQSLMDNFKDENDRALANRTFWCVCALDRRWSLGNSLPFALIDRDIDPKLPEPGVEFPYLRCVVAYSRLSSKVWEALPPFGSPSQSIPKETEDFLDFVTQNWLESIPEELQLRHPRLGLAPRSQPRTLHRLRVLLHLRANHMRTLIHRHHVLSSASIMANGQGARLVVNIAQDSVQVLMHLNETTNIYSRQQSVFNYYLVSALAVILLAVCHAPATFAEPCKDTFLAAVELVKGFSRHGTASRRLWKSIRGLLPGVKSLGLSSDAERVRNANHEGELQTHQDFVSITTYSPWDYSGADMNTDFGSSVPDFFNMSGDLMNLFDAFGQTAFSQPQADASIASLSRNDLGVNLRDSEEISRRFQGLI